MTSLCVFHRADYDGVCSAAIVKKFVPDCELYGIDYGDPFPWGKVLDGPQVSAAELEAGSGLPRRQVYMVDFSLKPDEMKRLNKCCDLTWIDHHKSAIDSCEGLGIRGIRHSGLAACELCWTWFDQHNGAITNELLVRHFEVFAGRRPEAVRLLGRYDVWDAKNPDWQRIEAFQFGMRAKPGMMNPEDPGWWTLISGECVEPILRSELVNTTATGRAILSYRDQEAKSLCADGAHVEYLLPPGGPFKGQRVNQQTMEGWCLVCLNSLQRGSWQFNSVWDPEKYDAMCVYGRLKNGKYRVSLYSTKEEVDCGAIAKALGGGGHKGAAGFICDKLPWE
jgi:oligoribonuclease NrnB/cAMP/cGMP phosphodiesterase (DHH superfamily)